MLAYTTAWGVLRGHGGHVHQQSEVCPIGPELISVGCNWTSGMKIYDYDLLTIGLYWFYVKTSLQSNLRRARLKGPTDSDDIL